MCVFLCGYYIFKTYLTNVNNTKQEFIYSVLFHHCYTHYSNASLWFKLSPPPLPDGVDPHDFGEGELQQPPLFLIQKGDPGPVYGHNEPALRERRT